MNDFQEPWRLPRAGSLPLVVVVAMVAAVGLGGMAGAAGGMHPLGRERPDVIQEWKQKLHDADVLLTEGRWGKAERLTAHLLDEMTRRIGSGEGAAPMLAMTSFFHAVAEAGLGNEAEALWDFGMAQALVADFRLVDLNGYGEAGKLLEASKDDAEQSESLDERPIDLDGKSPQGSVSKPVRRSSGPWRFPAAKFHACMDGAVRVRVVIDKEGIPRTPVLLSEQFPVFAVAAMRTIGRWRFDPAMLNGRPVPVYHRCSINFRVSDCQHQVVVARVDVN